MEQYDDQTQHTAIPHEQPLSPTEMPQVSTPNTIENGAHFSKEPAAPDSGSPLPQWQKTPQFDTPPAFSQQTGFSQAQQMFSQRPGYAQQPGAAPQYMRYPQQPGAAPLYTGYPQQQGAAPQYSGYPQQPGAAPQYSGYPQQLGTAPQYTGFPQRPDVAPPQYTGYPQQPGTAPFSAGQPPYAPPGYAPPGSPFVPPAAQSCPPPPYQGQTQLAKPTLMLPPGDPAQWAKKAAQAQAESAVLPGLRALSGFFVLTAISSLLLLFLFENVFAPLLGNFLYGINAFDVVPGEVVNELYTLSLYIIVFLLPYLGYARIIRYPLRSIPHDRPYPPVMAASMGVSMGASIVGVILSICLTMTFSSIGLNPPNFPSELPGHPAAFMLYMVNITFVPALIEEFTYRGIVLGSLRRYGDGFAILTSALFFGLMHRNMLQFPHATVLGIMLGYFMVKTNSIWTSMFIHFTNNAIALFMSVVVSDLSYVQIAAAEILQLLIYLLAAGAGLLYLLVLRRVRIQLAPSPCPVKQTRIAKKFLLTPLMLVLLLVFCFAFAQNFTW